MNFDVLAIGELNVDIILNDIDGFPESGKEKLAQTMTLTLGSSTAIFAANLASLGTSVGFLGRIGKDIFGNLVISHLEHKKVDTGLIIQDESQATGATIVLNYGEERANITYAGAMKHLKIDDIQDAHLATAKHLHFSSLYLQPNISKDISCLFKRAKSLGLSTSLDIQWDPSETWDFDAASILPWVDVFLPNETELIAITRKRTVAEALVCLQGIGNTIVVKRGNQGSVIMTPDKPISEIPVFRNPNLVDAIGAGDSFSAGFIHRFLHGDSMNDCQLFANLTGAINTTAAGGTAAFENRKRIIETARNIFNTNIEQLI